MNKRNIPTAIITTLVTISIVGLVLWGIFSLEEQKILAYVATRYLSILGQTSSSTNTSIALSTQDTLTTKVIAEANPAVISLVISKDVPVIEQYYAPDPFSDLFGNGMFNLQIPQYRQNGTSRREVGGGTAFIISPDGMAVTNNHVVSDTKASYTAFANDGKKYDVEVIARDATLDIAVIKIKGKPSPNYLSFGDSSTVKLGQTVIAIGNALGEYRNTVSVGVISGLSRSIVAGDPNAGEEEQLDEVLQTDAAINPGNSGGPLLDLSGRVIGMNTAIVSGSENIGFAIPATVIKAAVESVKQHGKILRPYMGVRYTQVTEALKEKNKLPVDYGALIVRGQSKDELAIVPGSPADKAGLVENDIILEIDGVNIDESHTLASLIRSKKVGDVITLNIYHKGETKTVKLTLASAPQ